MSKKEIKVTCINKPSDEKIKNFYDLYIRELSDKCGIDFLEELLKELKDVK